LQLSNSTLLASGVHGSSLSKVLEALKFGADAIQVGTATIRKFAIFNDINAWILEYLESKGAKNLGEIVGAAHK
jgi:dihydroorotate dehydrogenase